MAGGSKVWAGCGWEVLGVLEKKLARRPVKALGCYFWEVLKVLNLPKKAGQAREVFGVFEPLQGWQRGLRRASGGPDLRRIIWWGIDSGEGLGYLVLSAT